MFESLLNAFRAPDIRRRILYVLGILIVFRFLASVPLPGIDRDQLQSFLENNPIFGLLNLFSGGGLSQLSIVASGHEPVHQRVDHHAADDGGDPVAPGPQPGR